MTYFSIPVKLRLILIFLSVNYYPSMSNIILVVSENETNHPVVLSIDNIDRIINGMNNHDVSKIYVAHDQIDALDRVLHHDKICGAKIHITAHSADTLDLRQKLHPNATNITIRITGSKNYIKIIGLSDYALLTKLKIASAIRGDIELGEELVIPSLKHLELININTDLNALVDLNIIEHIEQTPTSKITLATLENNYSLLSLRVGRNDALTREQIDAVTQRNKEILNYRRFKNVKSAQKY